MSQIQRLMTYISGHKIEITGDKLSLEEALIKVLAVASSKGLDADELVKQAKLKCRELKGEKE